VGETATIAWRTRSKLPLQDTPLEQIELGFVAPDISADMYDTYCDDTDWKNFLCSIVKSDGIIFFLLSLYSCGKNGCVIYVIVAKVIKQISIL